MLYDLIIKNGTVIDPLIGEHRQKPLYVIKDQIVAPPASDEEARSREMIDAHGCYVVPGLIENHTHVFYGGSEAGYRPDLTLIPQGVTSAIDQGTSGASTFTSLYSNVIQHAAVDIKAYLNVSSTGLITERYMENINPAHFDRERIKGLFQQYHNTLIGLKIRIEDESLGGMQLQPLEQTMLLAEELGCPVSVHVKNLSTPLAEVAKLLRKDDVWVHMYQLQGNTILDNNNAVHAALYDAKARGVLFDVASGRSGFSFAMIAAAFNKGFQPDLLGTDLVRFNKFQRPLFSLLYTLSIYINLGLSLDEVIKKCTVLPARLMNMSSRIGSLQPGFQADISVIKQREGDILFTDRHGGNLRGNLLLTPQLTVKAGEVLYRNIEF